MEKMTCIDFNLKVAFSQYLIGGLAYEYWQNNFFSGHGLFSIAPLQNVRRPLQRRQSNKNIILSRSISLYI